MADPSREQGAEPTSPDPVEPSGPTPDVAATPASGPAAGQSAGGPEVDIGRRRFFRAFAGELIQTAVTVAGAAQALQQVSAQAAGSILNPAGAAALLGPAGDDPAGTPGASSGPTGFRTPFREDGGTLYLIDQRRLPDVLEEYPCRHAGEVAYAIREMIVRGAPAIGQVAAIGLTLSAEHQRDGRPYARRATLRGAANALINARPTAVNLRWAVERVMARYEEVGDLSEDGDAIADAMRAEADAIVFEATTDHGRLAGFGLEILPSFEDRPVQILTHCNTGPLACGQYGTALGIVQAAHHADRAGPRLGRRDASVSPGSPPDGLGAGPGRRPAHVAPRRGRRAPDGAWRGGHRPGRRRSGGGQRRHRQQDRHVHAGGPGGTARGAVLRLRSDQLDRPGDRRAGPTSGSRSAQPTRS